MDNSIAWKDSFSIVPAHGLPRGAREAARQLGIHIPTDTGCSWSKHEARAAKVLLESPAMVSVWCHLAKFIEDHYWFTLLVRVFIQPYDHICRRAADDCAFVGAVGGPGEPFNDEAEAEGNARHYARIAEHAFELLELLGDGPQDGDPGYLCEVDDLAEKGNIRENLLKLMALTTACEWPKSEHSQEWGTPSAGLDAGGLDGCRGAETVEVWVATRRKIDEEETTASWGGHRDYQGETYRFHEGGWYRYRGYVFRRNEKFYQKSIETPAYDYTKDSTREIFLKKNDPIPPLFEPLSFPEYSTGGIRANTPYMGYLKQVIENLDEFSSDDLDRPPRADNRGEAGQRSPLWLSADHCLALLGVLFPGAADVEKANVQRALRETGHSRLESGRPSKA